MSGNTEEGGTTKQSSQMSSTWDPLPQVCISNTPAKKRGTEQERGKCRGLATKSARPKSNLLKLEESATPKPPKTKTVEEERLPESERRIGKTSRIRAEGKFRLRSISPPAFQHEYTEGWLLAENSRFKEEEYFVDKYVFEACMKDKKKRCFEEGDQVIFLAESCFREGEVIGVVEEPVSLDHIPQLILESFPHYTVEKYPMQQYIVKFVGCPNEDDRYHTKIVPVYELYSRTPEYHDEDDRKMLLMAHDWNESVILHNPEAHHKARYASFFRLSPYEYVRRENSLYGGKTSYYRKLHWYDFNPYKYFPTNL